MSTWTFITNHARVMMVISQDPTVRLRDIASTLDITERAAQRIVTELVDEGYLSRKREGRRNTYTVHPNKPLRAAQASSTADRRVHRAAARRTRSRSHSPAEPGRGVGRGRTARDAIIPRRHAPTEAQRDRMGDRGLLRHPDRLGQGNLRRLQAGGRRRRPHARRQEPAARASTRSSTRSWPAPTSSTPRSCAGPPSRPPARSAGPSSPPAPSSCPTRSATGSPSASPTRRWTGSAQKYNVGIVSNIDDKLLGDLAPPPAHRARPRRHRPAGPQLQARAGPLQGVRAADRQEEGLGPHHQRPLHRRRAAGEDARARDLDQPPRREARERAPRSPPWRSRTSATPRTARSGCSAGCRSASPPSRRSRRMPARAGTEPDRDAAARRRRSTPVPSRDTRRRW